ncbi:hypothetical protein [Tenacibaculum maritimum]|uniref:hypothetical protein n=1 Tax=Tenacibaculum maritimum TaxID=107401 RepID=UPI0038768AEA
MITIKYDSTQKYYELYLFGGIAFVGSYDECVNELSKNKEDYMIRMINYSSSDDCGLMSKEINFKEIPMCLRDDVLKEMLTLNSDEFEKGKLFPNTILNEVDLRDYMNNNSYKPDDFFQCFTDVNETDFCLIPK